MAPFFSIHIQTLFNVSGLRQDTHLTSEGKLIKSQDNYRLIYGGYWNSNARKRSIFAIKGCAKNHPYLSVDVVCRN